MKKLTFSSMAAARLRANKRQYVSLVLGIFLSIFLISTLVLSVYGIYQAELQKRYNKVGYLDFVMLDNGVVTEEDIRSFDEFDRFGHAYISGIVTDKNVYVGYYDQVGLDLMNVKTVDGRLPETAGEIAIEASAMDILDVSWQIGETVELSITPVDGTEETCSFTLVGILPERSIYLSVSDHDGLSQFPAILTSSQEPAFTVGRLGTHYLMGLAKHATLDQAILAFWEKSENSYFWITNFYGLSTTGEQRQFASLGNMIDADREMFTLITIACTLALSLILSCGVGISGAMEGVLSKRREEIGVLRALGATRRLIRRMFGRENMLLALIVSPLSIVVSMGAVWVLSLLLSDSLKFAVNLWLIAPIALFSVIVILISGYLPLVRASKLMPMSVIRDTAMLRRSKKVKSKQFFAATRLIASRQVRFNPTRQIGASLLVGLMLLCSGLLSGFISHYAELSIGETTAFRIQPSSFWNYNGHIGIVEHNSMDEHSISQIRALSNVDYVGINRDMTVTVLLDHVPTYAVVDDQFGMLDDEQFEKAMENQGLLEDMWRETRNSEREDYLKFLEDYNIPGEAYRMVISTVELNSENLNKLNQSIESGKINVDAINAGTEVLVFAPEIWIKPYEDVYGLRHWYSEDAVKNDPAGEGAVLTAWNDTFFVGQNIPILQLYQTEQRGTVHRIDTNAVVGATLTYDPGILRSSDGPPMIVTTEQGLKNLGLLTEGLNSIEVYIDGEISLEDEEILERQLNAIARRYDGCSVINNLENHRRQETANQQTILLCAAVSLVFFSVSVGMIVSSVTRQLNSEGKTIGMLRAVGADQTAILGCYSGSLYASVGGGLFISLALLGIMLLMYLFQGAIHGYSPSRSEWCLYGTIGGTICLMSILCLVVCKFLLRFRIREIVNKSIIDNIREL